MAQATATIASKVGLPTPVPPPPSSRAVAEKGVPVTIAMGVQRPR